MKKFYERYWKNQKTLSDFYYKLPVVKKFIPKEKGVRVLDFGCGKGAVLAEILKINPNLKITGADTSEEALKTIKKRFKKYKFYKVQDGEKLPFERNTFDFILALDVLEHIYDTQNAFSELSRILKPDGKILITVPYYGLIKNLIIALFFFDYIFEPYSPHIRFFTKKTLLTCLSRVKLKPLQTGCFGRFYPVSNGMYVLAEKRNS
ncbi:MAG: class I SAM-dependent methyltransferase [Candidatus Levybacteria bacterium]|nr:class I SAM-dependent methyltransferase [Candidatus Levybacteria bacterium]